ncbi:MAG: hypothetical protein KDJ77_15730 [Rhodobiaceae bacterium]|nr:hypothetical protein [Rhodobiaceae bacterium]
MIVSTGHALAVEADFIDGVFSTEEGCLALTNKDPDANPVRLSRKGFDEIEWHCGFMGIDHQVQPEAWVATLLCEEPGYIYPDMVAMRFEDEKTLRVNFLSDEMAARAGGDPAYGEPFVRCEGVE